MQNAMNKLILLVAMFVTLLYVVQCEDVAQPVLNTEAIKAQIEENKKYFEHLHKDMTESREQLHEDMRAK